MPPNRIVIRLEAHKLVPDRRLDEKFPDIVQRGLDRRNGLVLALPGPGQRWYRHVVVAYVDIRDVRQITPLEGDVAGESVVRPVHHPRLWRHLREWAGESRFVAADLELVTQDVGPGLQVQGKIAVKSSFHHPSSGNSTTRLPSSRNNPVAVIYIPHPQSEHYIRLPCWDVRGSVLGGSAPSVPVLGQIRGPAGVGILHHKISCVLGGIQHIKNVPGEPQGRHPQNHPLGIYTPGKRIDGPHCHGHVKKLDLIVDVVTQWEILRLRQAQLKLRHATGHVVLSHQIPETQRRLASETLAAISVHIVRDQPAVPNGLDPFRNSPAGQFGPEHKDALQLAQLRA
mmetsp:Transcript_63808/g.146871  ORF Transcript_63808/g.146871 Transcript_63808/m.146871 type:complete len:341 (+) Transcript_63808:3410-4432(+)